MKTLSFDAETNGLYGRAFAIGAIVADDDGRIVAQYTGRSPIEGDVEPWIRENVLPNMSDIKESTGSYQGLLEDFFQFYKEHKEGADVIAHMAHPVETKVLRDMVEGDLESRMWDGPFPLIDVAGVLKAKGEDPTSVDGYIEKNGLYVPAEGLTTHHPLYDSIATDVAYRDLMKD